MRIVHRSVQVHRRKQPIYLHLYLEWKTTVFVKKAGKYLMQKIKSLVELNNLPGIGDQLGVERRWCTNPSKYFK